MDFSSNLINYISSAGDECLVDCATTHTILRNKKYFSNLTLISSNVQTISGPVDLIKGSGRATIVLPNGTKFQINNALYSNKSNRNLHYFSYNQIFFFYLYMVSFPEAFDTHFSISHEFQ